MKASTSYCIGIQFFFFSLCSCFLLQLLTVYKYRNDDRRILLEMICSTDIFHNTSVCNAVLLISTYFMKQIKKLLVPKS